MLLSLALLTYSMIAERPSIVFVTQVGAPSPLKGLEQFLPTSIVLLHMLEVAIECATVGATVGAKPGTWIHGPHRRRKSQPPKPDVWLVTGVQDNPTKGSERWSCHSQIPPSKGSQFV